MTPNHEPVETIVFDAVGTLIYPQPHFSRVYREAAESFGLVLSEVEIELRFATEFQRVNWDNTCESQQMTIWKQIVSRVFVELDDVEPIFAILWSHFAKPEAWSVFDDVVPTWQAVKSRGRQIAIGSNFDQRLLPICAGHEILRQCEHVFWSADLACSKPQTNFFQVIAERLAVPVQRLLMVGDDWENDYLGPREAGWRSVWLNRNGLNPAAPTELMIGSLVELTTIIDGC